MLAPSSAEQGPKSPVAATPPSSAGGECRVPRICAHTWYCLSLLCSHSGGGAVKTNTSEVYMCISLMAESGAFSHGGWPFGVSLGSFHSGRRVVMELLEFICDGWESFVG